MIELLIVGYAGMVLTVVALVAILVMAAKDIERERCKSAAYLKLYKGCAAMAETYVVGYSAASRDMHYADERFNWLLGEYWKLKQEGTANDK